MSSLIAIDQILCACEGLACSASHFSYEKKSMTLTQQVCKLFSFRKAYKSRIVEVISKNLKSVPDMARLLQTFCDAVISVQNKRSFLTPTSIMLIVNIIKDIEKNKQISISRLREFMTKFIDLAEGEIIIDSQEFLDLDDDLELEPVNWS